MQTCVETDVGVTGGRDPNRSDQDLGHESHHDDDQERGSEEGAMVDVALHQHDLLVVEIIDRRQKSAVDTQRDRSASADAVASEPIPMNLFSIQFSIERQWLLRSPFFARLLCGACQTAHKLQLNLRDPHTNLEAMSAATFFLESGIHTPSLSSLPLLVAHRSSIATRGEDQSMATPAHNLNESMGANTAHIRVL